MIVNKRRNKVKNNTKQEYSVLSDMDLNPWYSYPSIETILSDVKRGKIEARKLLKKRHGLKSTKGFRFDVRLSSQFQSNGITISIFSPDWKGHEWEVIWSIIT